MSRRPEKDRKKPEKMSGRFFNRKKPEKVSGRFFGLAEASTCTQNVETDVSDLINNAELRNTLFANRNALPLTGRRLMGDTFFVLFRT